ncbi:MAG: cation:proton antiporter [Acidobacteria bacterium]|nr:cation:proton antiporter [Acidobacteriota bacterium]
MQIILLAAVIGLMHAARSFAPQPGLGATPASITMAAGFILLAALFTGNLFKRCGLPQLTGYLCIGILVGPHVFDLVSERMLADLRIFNGVAIALIALTAGAEMDFRTMKPLLRGIAWVSGIAVMGTMLALSAAVWLAGDFLPFTAGLTPLQKLAFAVVLGVTVSAQSPAVAVALRTETEADGPLTRTVLGVVVASDLIVILLFAVTSTVARRMLGGASADSSPLAVVVWEVLGSAAAGVLIGMLTAAFLRTVQKSGALFIVVVGFLVAEVGERIALDPLLIALSAGMLIRNLTRHGDRLHAELAAASLPVYLGFFAVAGATIHLNELAVLGVPAAIFVLVRGAGFLTGTRIAGRIAGTPEVVSRYAGFGLLPQSGLALAIALLFARMFPQFGAQASALVFGIVGINELAGPVLYRWALLRSGEAGKAGQPVAERAFAPIVSEP